MKLIAIHEIVRKSGAVQPGETFDATDKEAVELIGLGAARAAVVEDPVVEEPVKAARKKKAESDDSVI